MQHLEVTRRLLNDREGCLVYIFARAFRHGVTSRPLDGNLRSGGSSCTTTAFAEEAFNSARFMRWFDTREFADLRFQIGTSCQYEGALLFALRLHNQG